MPAVGAALLLIATSLWLRWPTFGFALWNVDESIHAAAARVILDGGVLYRDAIDQRTPLTYYAVAGINAIFGANNLWAVRAAIALLVAATGWLLFIAGRRLRDGGTGLVAGVLYVLLASSTLFQGDANAANTEWFVAFFSSAAAAGFLLGGSTPGRNRLVCCGLLSGCAFLSKQPALLDAGAPLAVLLYLGWREGRPRRTVLLQILAFIAGWLAPVLLTALYFAAHGALRDAVFYTWTYNLSYYGPEITATDRLAALLGPFRLIGTTQPWLLLLWVAAAVYTFHRLVQREPTPAERTGNPPLLFVGLWSLTALAGSAASGRSFDHYSIQFLAPFCLGAGLVVGHLGRNIGQGTRHVLVRTVLGLLLAVVAWNALSSAFRSRLRTLPEDPSRRVAAYIKAHSTPADALFVWGYHPDIYLYADRRPASRFLYASFLTGLIPWTNTAPERDTAYAVVPGALPQLLADLHKRPPLFIVDCSAGPNRFWQKYPTEHFPAFHAFLRARYRLVESHQFVPQGFRLYQRRPENEPAANDPAETELPAAVTATLQLGTLGSPLAPVRATAPHGANRESVDGHVEYFAHAPASLVYRVPATTSALRGSFGIRPGAYAPENPGPTDGVEFIVRWRPTGGTEQILLRRLLLPREEPADRGLHAFQVTLPPHAGGELELVTGTGPFENAASDWSYWRDLLLENDH
jgi:4-amino-4-deoxy-L-arabinose transferase-like glycosyltransferase